MSIPGYNWVATDFIYLPGAALAFGPGQLVPDQTVANYGWDLTGQVAPVTGPPAEPQLLNLNQITVGEVA